MGIYSVFTGMVIFQMIYVIFQYVLFKRREFIYYFIYTALVAIYVSSKLTPSLYNNFFQTPEETSVIGRGVITIAYGTYFKFGRYFTNSNFLYRRFSLQLSYVETFLISIGLVDVVLQVTGSMPFATADIVFNVIHLALVVYSLGVVYFLLRKKNKLTTILVLGSFILVLCASISIIDALFITKGQMSDAYYAFYIELGIIGELLFLNYGLNYKTKMEQNEKTRMEVERQMMLANERNRISADLHDDIGATLSSMHIYGDLASSLWESQPEESKEMVGRISRQSKDLMERMSDIVWSLRPPGEDNSLITNRLRNYTHDLLGGKNIAVILEIDELLAEKIINPMARKNILLIVKEAVNNIAKYSEATEAGIAFIEQEQTMELRISDNGAGFKTTGIRYGNGMGNIEQRCKQMGGYCTFESTPGKGVLIRCFFPLAIISHIG